MVRFTATTPVRAELREPLRFLLLESPDAVGRVDAGALPEVGADFALSPGGALYLEVLLFGADGGGSRTHRASFRRGPPARCRPAPGSSRGGCAAPGGARGLATRCRVDATAATKEEEARRKLERGARVPRALSAPDPDQARPRGSCRECRRKVSLGGCALPAKRGNLCCMRADRLVWLAILLLAAASTIDCAYGIPCDRVNIYDTCRPAWNCSDGKRYEMHCTTEDGGNPYYDTEPLTCSCVVDGVTTKTWGPTTSRYCTNDERETRSAANGHCGFPIFNQ